MNAIRLMGFKADGQAHRLWQRLYLGEEDDEKYVFFSLYPSITETNGRRWSNSEPTIYYCSKKHFYNIILNDFFIKLWKTFLKIPYSKN